MKIGVNWRNLRSEHLRTKYSENDSFFSFLLTHREFVNLTDSTSVPTASDCL